MTKQAGNHKLLEAKQGAELPLPDFCAGNSVLILILVSELLVIAMVLVAYGVRGFSWDYLALMSLLVQWIALSSAWLICRATKKLSAMPINQALIRIYVLVLLVTLVASLIGEWVLGGMLLVVDIDWAAVGRNTLVAAIFAGMLLRYFFLQAQLRNREQSELRARLQALQARIRPHFLFNTMNTIASLIQSRPESAEQAIVDLSELFRASLGKADIVALEDEIALCRSYISIEQLRLGERLTVEWDLAEMPTDASIPQLCMQPLLENAIYHGIQPLPEGGVIKVLIAQEKDQLQITISNPIGSDDIKSDGQHMALENINSRLQAVYGPDAGLSTHKTDQFFVVQLLYPLNIRAGKPDA